MLYQNAQALDSLSYLTIFIGVQKQVCHQVTGDHNSINYSKLYNIHFSKYTHTLGYMY